MEIDSELYRFLFEMSLDAILLTGPDGRIYRANAAACALFGYSEEEICHIGREGLVDTSDPRLQKALEDRASYGRVRAELTYIKKDGTTFPGDVTSALFNDSRGNVRSAMIVRDMTHYRAAEELLRRAQEEAAYYAAYDDLTGVCNRRSFVEMLTRTAASASPEVFPLCLLLTDIDRFKTINDTFGHPCGDLVLRRFATCLGAHMRQPDVLGRYGGDEFIVCLPGMHLLQARDFAEKLRRSVSSMAVEYEGHKIFFTASFGLACCEDVQGSDVDRLIRRVDNALYAAKVTRNCVFSD